ncbi:MAG: DUF4169 family protein [Pseudomonadota bacterium]
MPGDVINLRQRRKAMKRAAERAEADRRSILHGLPKTVTDLAEARRAKDDSALEAHRLEETSGRERE